MHHQLPSINECDFYFVFFLSNVDDSRLDFVVVRIDFQLFFSRFVFVCMCVCACSFSPGRGGGYNGSALIISQAPLLQCHVGALIGRQIDNLVGVAVLGVPVQLGSRSVGFRGRATNQLWHGRFCVGRNAIRCRHFR